MGCSKLNAAEAVDGQACFVALGSRSLRNLADWPNAWVSADVCAC